MGSAGAPPAARGAPPLASDVDDAIISVSVLSEDASGGAPDAAGGAPALPIPRLRFGALHWMLDVPFPFTLFPLPIRKTLTPSVPR